MLSSYQIFSLCLLPAIILADTCTSPVVKSSVQTTNDAILSSQTAFIVEFSLSCKNSAKNVELYAEFNGRTYSVGRNGNNYQVSFTGEHKELPSGTYNVNFFDDEGFNNLKKSQRSEEQSEVKSLFMIPVAHKGLSKGKYVQTELLALIVFSGICYYASKARAQLHK